MKGPDEQGAAVFAALQGYLDYQLPELRSALTQEGGRLAPEADREVAVFAALCVAQTLAQQVLNAEQRRAVLTGFFQRSAGAEPLADFMAKLEPSFRAYQRAMKSGGPADESYKAAVVLYDRLCPGRPYDVNAVERLKGLVADIEALCRKALAGL